MSEVVSRTVGPTNAKKAIRRAIKSRRPIFIWGPPGIGKSDIVKQLGEELDAHVIDVRLSLWEPTDIKGIPYFDSNRGTMVWAPPEELPSEEFAAQHKSVILFFDEMNSAAPAVLAAAYQLILNRRVGQYVLPDNVYIIAAGNREADRGVTYRMPAPLANRFVHLEMTVNWDDWFTWAVKTRIHKDVIGFLTSFKRDLYDFDPKSSAKAFATPRSWMFVSDLLDDDTDETTVGDLVAGAIGEGLGIKFMAHRRIASKLPKPEDILSGDVTTIDTSEISAMYALTISLCYELKDACERQEKNFHSKANYFLQFMMDNFQTELIILGMRLATQHYGITLDPDEIPCFSEFYTRYSKFIFAAAKS